MKYFKLNINVINKSMQDYFSAVQSVRIKMQNDIN